MKMKLFPFNKIPKNSNIVIYGMGQIGERFVMQINCLSYCNIVGCIDKMHENMISVAGWEILPPKAIGDMNYDYVVVASEKYKFDIESILLSELFVPSEKIVLLDDEYYTEEYITPERNWTNYYIYSEKSALSEFEKIIEPVLEKYSLINKEMKVMDFACGRGRIANFLKDNYKKLILCDISKDALDYCKMRFDCNSNIEYIQSLPQEISINDESLDLIYSWDAMVHFNYKMLDIYISEFSRILKNGGYCFIHHSNLDGCMLDGNNTSENFNENIEWRAKICKQDVMRIAKKSNFEILEQIDVDLGFKVKNIDCITVLKKCKTNVL
ncbi:class I SAM-dependent methyltransferase [Clostridium sp. BL-8]|uniref:class I SAM-dependent methyltransferase n=1 Tax=Clostridium sp. BL-8 TaxID=349938 RepID=UPI00098CE037|nr:class I SAM-dependent methyltransferase [Clostridium sp. BL-8]OOM79966.1 ubiquinone/menaquinone biosynthesis C-methyltransferase UbiE [Clostridium sp. BL-8]